MGLTKASYALINGAYYNVLDFGAKADNLTDDQPAIQAAINAAKAAGGGTVFLPAGTYKVNDTLTLTPSSSWFNVYIQGAGAGATTLNFAGVGANKDGIAVSGWGGRFGFEGFTVKNAKRHGIYINNSTNTEYWVNRFYIDNVISDSNDQDGFHFGQSYMGGFTNLESRNNGNYGFYLGGFHTSFIFERCWAGGDGVNPDGGNGNAGWYINNITYSSFISCASDWSDGPGYVVDNCAGVTFQACGSESNDQEGFLVRSSTPTSVSGANDGLSFNACFGYNNGIADKAVYANFMGISTANAVGIYVNLTNCSEKILGDNTYSLVLNGTSGSIACNLDNCQFQAAQSKSGSVELYDRSLAGYVATGTRATNFSVPNNTETIVPITSFFTNEINATLDTGKIVIPAGVNRIRITAGIAWNTAAGGERAISIYYNNSGFYGNGAQETTGVGYVSQTTGTALIDVAQGGLIDIRAIQGSGAALDVLGENYGTFVQIEVIG